MRVLITLEEKGVNDFDFQEIDMAAGEHKVQTILRELHTTFSGAECAYTVH
jgi:hypothetical protein